MGWSSDLINERRRKRVLLVLPPLPDLPVNRCLHARDELCDSCVDDREGPGSPGPTYSLSEP